MIVCDKEPDNVPTEEEAARIMSEIKQVGGIKRVYMAPMTANLMAFASWHESEIPEKTQAILSINGVKDVTTKILVRA